MIEEKKIRRCARCVMDSSRPGISFDSEGLCNYCNEYINITSKRAYQEKISDTKLLHLVTKIKQKGSKRKYDCVIGISGGVDSSYAAYMVKKYGLRALAVHLDNGWDSDVSVRNIRYLMDKLGFDYESYVLDWEVFRDLQLAFLKASVPDVENPTDIAIPGALHEIAVKYKVKYIISGGNYATEGFLPKYFQYNAKDTVYLKAIHKRFGTKKLNCFPTFGWQKEIFYKFVKGIRIIYILNLIPYSKNVAISTLEKEFGWKYYGGKHYESVYTRFVQGYLLPEKFKIDYRKITYSMQVLTGEMAQEEALSELAKPTYDSRKIEDDISYVCKKLGISLQEFHKIMKLPVKVFHDYPNDENKLEFIYKIYRKLASLFN